MRFAPDFKFWVVIDPTADSTMEDIVLQASLKDLDLQFKGGLKIEENPTLFTEKREAELEAHGRFLAMRAALAIARSDARFRDVTRLELLDGDGNVLFETDLPAC